MSELNETEKHNYLCSSSIYNQMETPLEKKLEKLNFGKHVLFEKIFIDENKKEPFDKHYIKEVSREYKLKTDNLYIMEFDRDGKMFLTGNCDFNKHKKVIKKIKKLIPNIIIRGEE